MRPFDRPARGFGVVAAAAALCTSGWAHAVVAEAAETGASTSVASLSEGRSPPVSAAALMEQPQDGSLEASRPSSPSSDTIEATAPLRWTASASLVGQSYRYSLQRGPVDIGVRFATPASSGRPQDARGFEPSAAPYQSQLPAISLGLQRGSGPQWERGSLLERATNPSRGENYSSKVGVEWKPAESQVHFLREGLGLRLDGNDRMTVRLRKGVVGIYMHRKF
jgi:hypothetical protein